MDITKFGEKFNKLDGNVYTAEEKITLTNGVYEADLAHDNVEPNTINIYTGSRLTGDKINTYTISTPSLAPWRTHIKIYSNEPTLYISYETVGDTVEADDINNVQDAINLTQEELNKETSRAEQAETLLQDNLNEEIDRAKKAESDEATRATNAESTLQNNIDTGLSNRYTKQETFTKDEVLKKIQDVIGTAPEALDTLKEIADALNNDSDFAGTMTKELSKKSNVGHTHTKSEITDMPTKLSEFDNDSGFIKSTDSIATSSHTHSNKTVLDGITSSNINDWNDGKRKVAFIGSDVANSNGWYKVASQTCSGYGDTNITFMVTSTYAYYRVGILQLQIRSNNTSISCERLSWAGRTSGVELSHYIVVINDMTWTLYAYQPCAQYGRICFEILSMSSITSKTLHWDITFKDNNTKETTKPVATLASWDDFRVSSSIRATQDSDGKQINTTYVKKGMTWNELEGI